MPPVDLSEFTTEQKQLFNRANALGTGVQTIDSSNIAPSQGELNIPTFQQQSPQEIQSAIKSIPEIVTEFNRETPVETTQNQIVTELLSTLRETQGREQAQFQAEQEAGIPEQTKRLQELSGRLTQLQNEALATPLQIQEEFAGRGATAGGVEPIQTARLRQNAIQSLTIGAQAQALQGNIALAQQQVNRAVDLQFKPIEDRLQFLQTAYTLNKDTLDRLDKKRSEQLQINLRERERQLAERKAERASVGEVLTKAASFGAPQSVVDAIGNARTFEEAVSLAGPYMQDPLAKQQLLNAQADYNLKQLDLRLKGIQVSEALGLVGGEGETAQADGLRATIDVMDAISSSRALDSVVGTTIFGRTSGGLLGTAGRIAGGAVTGASVGAVAGFPFAGVGAVPGAVVGGIIGGIVGGATTIDGSIDAITGDRQNFIASVEQLTDKQFLNNLIDVKSQGATFGALSDREGDALRRAATKIGTWRQTHNGKSDGRVVGYNIDEKSFRAEIQTIRDLTIKAYERSTGQKYSEGGFSPDEQAFFNSLQDSPANFDPTY